MNVIFLGAGKPTKGSDHAALNKTTEGSRVLDWLLQAIPNDVDSFQFVGGYQMDEIIRKYPHFNFVTNPDWQHTGATGSLLKANIPKTGRLLVTYSDILYRKEAVKNLISNGADVTVAVDSEWKERYFGRSEHLLKSCEKVHVAGKVITRLGSELNVNVADAEFIGLACFNKRALAEIIKLQDFAPEFLVKAHLSGLVEWLRLKGLKVSYADVRGDWAELDDPRDLAHFVLGTKAQTLERLQRLVTKSRIEDQLTFTVYDWQNDKEKVVEKIQSAFNNSSLVIRSSALSEDGFTTANAGVYKTLLDVSAQEKKKVADSINAVVESYPDENPDNQVLVQPMIQDIKASGVAFTRTLAYGAPYYIINYDDTSGSTESITSGSSADHKTLVVRKDAPEKPVNVPEHLRGLVPALKEIESLVEYDSLDIEFAINRNNRVHVFQVRPIAVDHSKWDAEDREIYDLIGLAENHYEQLQVCSPYIMGRKGVYGIMPDWNPAEIIGTNTGNLAKSLYSYLIMDDVWATQRSEYGYRDVRPQPLLVSFAGKPYVDVRASFNSFVPAKIDAVLTNKLVDFYLDWLCRHPHFHDKVEFEIVPTCYGLDFERWGGLLMNEGAFTENEVTRLGEALKEITCNAFYRNDADLKSIAVLEVRNQQVKNADIPHLEKTWVLLEDCRRYGTLAFSHLARSAFVAMTLLKSAVWKKIISNEEMYDFLNTIRTVGHDIMEDSRLVASGNLKWKSFVGKYGHLRPGTYDITSQSYAEDPKKYLWPMVEKAKTIKAQNETKQAGAIWEKARSRFVSALKDNGLTSDSTVVEQFLRKSIEGREYAKFVFTKNLSLALDSIVEFGSQHKLSREKIANIDINDILGLRRGSATVLDVAQWLKIRSEDGLFERNLSAIIELPPLITKKEDFQAFVYPASQANFIGSGRVRAECINLSGQRSQQGQVNISGKIVMIPRADPGYDWLFGQGIAGLITMYGGANSHMAIRSAEFGLPAAIGVGETTYKRFSDAVILELNAGNRQIQKVQ